MFNKTFFRLALPCAFAFAGFSASALPAAAPQTVASVYQMVVLSAGTNVSLALNESFDAEEVATGNAIDFQVRSNVTVNGKVVIAAGATATGWVKKVKKSSDGKSIEITITVESVMAVDGQSVNVRSIPHVIQGHHGSAKADIGANLTAHILNDVKINA
jgi:hypothetical protein